VDDRYGTSAENYDILLKHYGLESSDVAARIKANLAV
jgi:transketolase